jgi:hypothetical protein
MKHLKTSLYLLLTAAVFTSCEKETTTLPENAEMNSSTKLELSSYKSMADAVKDGFDLGAYVNSLPKHSFSKKTEVNYLMESGLEFYFNNEAFFESNCYDLPMEDFNNYNYLSSFPNYLDQYTDNGVYSSGSIIPNISFTTTNTNINSQYEGFWTWYDVENVNSDLELATNFAEEDLIINFYGTNVLSAGMKVSSITGGTTLEIQVYGTSGYLGSAYQYAEFWGPDYYFGVVSDEPITKIIISDIYNYGPLSIDNVSFGNCDDLDGDGVLNANDMHPNSDLRKYLVIGRRMKIENKMVKNGITMMDQINDLIAEINSQYNGQNYAYLHKRFMTELSQITYNWRMARLITATQRSQISSIAWRATIPYYNN